MMHSVYVYNIFKVVGRTAQWLDRRLEQRLQIYFKKAELTTGFIMFILPPISNETLTFVSLKAEFHLEDHMFSTVCWW